MIEKLKYFLHTVINSKQMRVGCIAVLTAVTIAAGTLLNRSIKTIVVSDGDIDYTIHTTNNNIASAVSNLKLKQETYNIVSTAVKNGITNVKIEYTFPVYITCGDKTTTVKMSKGTVSDALSLAGYTADQYDIVEPSCNVILSNTEYIDYTDIDFVSGSYTEPVPYTYETIYSKDVGKGTTKTIKDGSNGLQNVDYTSKFVNGNVVESNITAISLLSDPINGVRVVGTKETNIAIATSSTVKSTSTLTPVSAIELDSNGNPINFSSKMTVRATAYTYTGHNCSTGVAPQPGYIAVNPEVIPYGTKMYIKTSDGSYIYGYAVAADTGGFIKNHPTGVDLFMSTKSACTSFGVRNVEIYILN